MRTSAVLVSWTRKRGRPGTCVILMGPSASIKGVPHPSLWRFVNEVNIKRMSRFSLSTSSSPFLSHLIFSYLTSSLCSDPTDLGDFLSFVRHIPLLV